MNKSPYSASFWWAYLANTALMVTVSLLFRYADFVTDLGGTEKDLGIITGLGMLGAILARCFQGAAIDRYGPVRIWRFSLMLLVACLLGHLAIRSIDSPWIYLARILYSVGLAGSFGASITFVSFQAPVHRMAEMIGILGSSGFIGMGLGPILGDWIFSGDQSRSEVVRQMFLLSSGTAALSLLCMTVAGRFSHGRLEEADADGGESHSPSMSVRRMGRAIWQYFPGWILLVGVAMGVGIGMPGTFLRPFAADRGMDGIREFFLVYAVVAFSVRVLTRRLPDRWGTRPTIFLGLGALTSSLLAYLLVSSPWLLMVPAILVGLAHAFLFPAVVAEANHAFPPRNRGLATNLILTMFDAGSLVGFPLIGWTIEWGRSRGIDGYLLAFVGLAALMVAVMGVYSFSRTSRLRLRELVAVNNASAQTEPEPAPALADR